MSFSETIFLFFLALIIFGPKKLPEIARTVGKALNEFKRASNEFKAQIEQEISHLEVENKQTILPPSTPPEGSTSRSRYAGAELEATVEAPALAAPASAGASTEAERLAESSSGGAASSTAVSGEVASDYVSPGHASSEDLSSNPSPAPEQSPLAVADPAEAVTASDPVGAAVAPESQSSESRFPESHPSESHA
jgi:TatA/E family protein of Tat protein translocase